MYPIAVNDILQVIVEYQQANVTFMINTFNYRVVSPAGGVTDGQGFLNDLLNTHFIPLTGETWTQLWRRTAGVQTSIVAFEAQKIFPARFQRTRIETATAGTALGPSMPGVVQWTITRRSLEAERGKIGGLRIPGIGSDRVEDGQLVATFAAEFADCANFAQRDLTVPLFSGLLAPIVFRRSSPNLSPNVSSAEVQSSVRAQRTRINFRGI